MKKVILVPILYSAAYLLSPLCILLFYWTFKFHKFVLQLIIPLSKWPNGDLLYPDLALISVAVGTVAFVGSLGIFVDWE